ncbi:hypothetical protein GCM10010244_83910 [Streptomyces coeruleorubidus]|nr:hypothetical protein GCM10010244_83910 [Streptomyces bellus]
MQRVDTPETDVHGIVTEVLHGLGVPVGDLPLADDSQFLVADLELVADLVVGVPDTNCRDEGRKEDTEDDSTEFDTAGPVQPLGLRINWRRVMP